MNIFGYNHIFISFLSLCEHLLIHSNMNISALLNISTNEHIIMYE